MLRLSLSSFFSFKDRDLTSHPYYSCKRITGKTDRVNKPAGMFFKEEILFVLKRKKNVLLSENRDLKPVSNGFVKPELIKERIQSYELSDLTKQNETELKDLLKQDLNIL